MRKLLAVAVGLLVCAPVWASRGRPVSDLRFEGKVSPISGYVASDGKDFLFLSTAGIGGFPEDGRHVYVQRVAGSTPVGPSLAIDAGVAAGIVWNGVDYLVSWSGIGGMWTAHVSRQGALIEGSKRLVVSHSGSFASNAQSALAVARIDDATIVAQPLDLTGRLSGPGVTLNLPSGSNITVGPSSNGFAIVSTGWLNTSIWRLRPDGTPLSPSPVIIEGPYDINAGYNTQLSVVATDGTDTLIVFTAEKFSTDTELKTAVIGPDGSLKRTPRTAYTMPGMGPRSLQPTAAVWTGSGYAISLYASKDPTGQFSKGDTGVLQISRTGDAIDVIAYATSGDRRKVSIGLGWNGVQFLLPWYDTDNQRGYGSFGAAIPMATMTPTAPAALDRSLNAQTGLKIAAGNGQYLAAWYETGSVITVRASRIDAAGNFLDGEGIALGAVPSPPLYTLPSIAIDSDGTNWLVAWANGTVRGRRLSRDGALLDAQPFFITGGTDVAVRWNGSNYVVVGGNDSLSCAAVSRDGVATSSRTLMPSSFHFQQLFSTSITYTSPSVVVVRGETMVVYLNVVTTCGGIQGACGDDTTIVGWRLDSSANPVGAAMTLAKNAQSSPMLATDGTRQLLAWSAFDAAVGTRSIFGTVLSEDAPLGGAPFRIASKAVIRDVAFDGGDFVVAFENSTSPYRAGTFRVTPDGGLKEMTMLPLDDGESASSPAIAASPAMPALVGYINLHPAYDAQSRGALLFNSELTPSFLSAPFPPSVSGALRIDQNTIDVRWKPSLGVFGTAVELQLEDGAFRTIGVAAGGASSGRFSLAGLQGTAIRLRSWNAAGLSEASTAVPIALPRQRSVRGQ